MPPLGPRFDVTLRAARAGEEWAWCRIYDELSSRLLAYARARGCVEPEDVVGEVFLQVVRDLTQFEGTESDFRAWVFAIARNRFIDSFRRARRQPVGVPSSEDLLDQAVADVADEAIARLDAERAYRLIGRLSPDQQDVLLLRIFGDMTIEQVARVLGKRPNAVKALQRRGLAALRRQITKEGVPL